MVKSEYPGFHGPALKCGMCREELWFSFGKDSAYGVEIPFTYKTYIAVRLGLHEFSVMQTFVGTSDENKSIGECMAFRQRHPSENSMLFTACR